MIQIPSATPHVSADTRYVSPHAPPLPLLITGVAGVAGYNAFHYFRSLYGDQVVGTRRSDNWPLQMDGIEPCDAGDDRRMAELFDRYQFGSVLNCEGSCKLKSCELDPAMAQRINIASARQLIRQIENTATRLVSLSVDLVFSGLSEGDYREDDLPDAVTVYGQSMVEGEGILLAGRPDAALLRISLPMGISFNGHAGAIDWIQSRFMKGKPATLYFDEIRTPKYTDCLNHLCHTMLNNSLAGVFHAGGPRKLSLYQIAQIVNRVGGYAPDHLMGCWRVEAGPIPPRAGNVTLDSSKLTDVLGYCPFDPWPLDQRWVPTHSDWHRDRQPQERGSAELLRQLLYENTARRNVFSP